MSLAPNRRVPGTRRQSPNSMPPVLFVIAWSAATLLLWRSSDLPAAWASGVSFPKADAIRMVIYEAIVVVAFFAARRLWHVPRWLLPLVVVTPLLALGLVSLAIHALKAAGSVSPVPYDGPNPMGTIHLHE